MVDPDLPAVPGPGGSVPPPPTGQQVALDRIQYAVANDRIEFSELDDLYERVFSATTDAEIEAAVAHLPVPVQLPPPNSRHFASPSSFSLIGDIKIGGWLAVGPRVGATSIIGDTVVDVSSAAIADAGLDVVVRSLIGDVKVIVPDGARVQITVTTIVGDRKEVLVAPVPEGPIIRINLFNLIGDTAVYSLSAVPEGRLRRIWAALRRPNGG